MAVMDTLLGKIKSGADRVSDTFLGSRQQPQQNDILKDYLDKLSTYDYVQPLLKEYTPEQLQMGVRNNLNFGVPEIADWQQQYNQGAGRNNPLVTPDNPEQFKQDLKDNKIAVLSANAIEAPRQGGIIRDLLSGYRENVSTPFAVENLENTDKSFATRIGEGLGTARRLLDNPISRGLITAGLVGATGGSGADALTYGLQSGVTRQKLTTQDKAYRKQLEDMGVDTSDIKGNITDDIYKNISDTYHKQTQNTYKNQKMIKDNYYKRVNFIQRSLQNGMISPEMADRAIKEARDEYALELLEFQASNQTRNTDINAWLAPAKAEGYKGMAALRPLQGANIASQIEERDIDIKKKKNDLAIDQMVQEAMNASGIGTPTKKNTFKQGKYTVEVVN